MGPPRWTWGLRLGPYYVGTCTASPHVTILRSGRGTYCAWHRLRKAGVAISIGTALGRACLMASSREIEARYERWQQGERVRRALLRSRPSR